MLRSFAALAREQQDDAFALRCVSEADTLCGNLATHAWDGDWYRRAWFDDGAVLGSAGNVECRIDSIAQSWSVLSGASSDDRARRAMGSLDRHLVRRGVGIIQLLDPPFDTSPLDPGYIKGYVPGVRENGGQYTHAAIWAAMAFARQGDSKRAWELFALINPIHHARDAEGLARYKVEPYVVAADVYGVAPHGGRGGWTWYTGSAGWLYRLIVESLLGIHREADHLRISPCLPASWPGYSLDYRFGASSYRITVRQSIGPGLGTRFTLDGLAQTSDRIPLLDDAREHVVVVDVVVAGGDSA